MVHINGKDIDVAGQSLMDFLNANDYEMGTFVVECNEEIIHKEDYKTYILRDGDVIEVVQFMGGGCGTSLMYRSPLCFFQEPITFLNLSLSYPLSQHMYCKKRYNKKEAVHSCNSFLLCFHLRQIILRSLF